MKKNNFYIISCVILLSIFVGCNPDEQEIVTPYETILVSRNVGISGATLSSGNVSIEIPSGCFSEDHTITLVSSPNTVFIGNGITPLYYLKGIPADFSSPIVMKISNVDTSKKCKAFVSEVVLTRSITIPVRTFRRVDYAFSNGIVSITFPPLPNAKSTNELTDQTIDLGASLANSIDTYTSSHFEITFPANVHTQIPSIANFLENAYDTYESSPFSLSYSNRTSWPMQVTVANFGDEIYGYMEPSLWGNNYVSLILNKNKLNNAEEMEVTCAHEFMHAVQYWYDNRNAFSKAKLKSPNLWLDEAVAVWVEEQFADPGYISAARKGNEYEPIKGGIDLSENNNQSFGYGMSAMIKYLVNKNGIDLIKDIYNGISNGKTPKEAIKLATSEGNYSWWPEFITSYFYGDIYSDFDEHSVFSVWKKIQFDLPNPTEISYSTGLKPLETKFLVLDLKNSNNAAIFPKAQAIIKCNDNFTVVQAFLLTYDPNSHQYSSIQIGNNENIDSIKIIKAGEKFKIGNKMIVMVTNPSSESNKNFDGEFYFKTDIPFLFVNFKYEAYIHYKCLKYVDGEPVLYDTIKSFNDINSTIPISKVNNNHYIGNFNDGTIDIYFNSTFNQVQVEVMRYNYYYLKTTYLPLNNIHDDVQSQITQYTFHTLGNSSHPYIYSIQISGSNCSFVELADYALDHCGINVTLYQ